MKNKDGILDKPKERSQKGKWYALFSLFLGLYPWLFYLYLSIKSPGGTSENNDGLAFLAFWIYCLIMVIPSSIIAIMFAQEAFKCTKKTKNKFYYLSIIALILGWLPIISVCIFLFVVPLLFL